MKYPYEFDSDIVIFLRVLCKENIAKWTTTDKAIDFVFLFNDNTIQCCTYKQKKRNTKHKVKSILSFVVGISPQLYRLHVIDIFVKFLQTLLLLNSLLNNPNESFLQRR